MDSSKQIKIFKHKQRLCRTRSWSFLKYCLLILAVLAFPVSVTAQGCDSPNSTYKMYETFETGRDIFNLSAPGNIEWSYELPNSPGMRNYLTLTKDIARAESVMRVQIPIDLDDPAIQDILGSGVTIQLELTCQQSGASDVKYDSTLIVKDVNEFAPEFNTSSIEVWTKENVPSTQTLIRLLDWASDKDFDISREISTFAIARANVGDEINGQELLQLTPAYTGAVSAKTLPGLDFETLPNDQKFVVVQVIVYDDELLSGTSTLTVHIEDDDDLDPVFYYPGCPAPCELKYTVNVSPNYTGSITEGLEPAPIQARDGDALDSPVTFALSKGPVGYQEYISLDTRTGELAVLKELHNYSESNTLVFIIKATEDTPLRRSTETSLLITVGDTGGGPFGTGSSTDDDDDSFLIVIIVLGIILFICVVVLVVGLLLFRKKWKDKSVHPEGRQPIVKEDSSEPVDNAHNARDDQLEPRHTVTLSEEPLRGEEEFIMWMPPKDLVDLSDEDTIKRKMGIPPSKTALTSRDSAFEESDKKSGSDDSNQCPETIYAEVDTPPAKRKDYNSKVKSGDKRGKRKAMPLPNEEQDTDHVYMTKTRNVSSSGPDSIPPNHDSAESDCPKPNSVPESGTFDSGLDEAEYVMPVDTGREFRPPPFLNNPAFRHDNDTDQVKKRKQDVKTDQSLSDNGSVDGLTSFNGGAIDSAEEKRIEVGNDEDEIAEYSVPSSNRLSTFGHPYPVPVNEREETTTGNSLGPRLPTPPQRPKVKGGRDGALIYEEGSTEDPYARVTRRKDSRSKRSPNDLGQPVTRTHTDHRCPTDDNGDDNNKDVDDNNDYSSADNGSPRPGISIHPPSRRKRHRRRNKPVRSPEEDIYDGTKDYENLEVDSGFYTDTSKIRVKRSTRMPPMRPDPNDTRYWITVTNDY